MFDWVLAFDLQYFQKDFGSVFSSAASFFSKLLLSFLVSDLSLLLSALYL